MNNDVLQQVANEIAISRDREEKAAIAEGGGYYIPFGNFASLGSTITGNAAVFLATAPRYAYIVSWIQTFQVIGVNNSTNYWKIKLLASVTTMAEILTNASAANTWVRYPATSWTLREMPVNTPYFNIETEKVGTPGAFYLAGPLVYAIGA